MAKIDFTPKQIEELKNHYILELERLQKRTSEIMGILSKLIHEPGQVVRPIDTSIIKSTPPAGKIKPVIQTGEKKRRGRPPASLAKSPLPGEQKTPVDQTEEKTKRRGRPSNNSLWGEFIIQLLNEKGKPQSREQIIHAYQKKNKVDVSGSKPAMSALNQAIQHLRVRKNRITSIRQEGKKGKLFALVNTADSSTGNIKAKQKKQSKIALQETSSTETKYNWSQFVLDTLAKTKRILSLKDFYNYAMVEYTIPAGEKKSTYGKLSPVLTQMVRRKDTIRTIKKDGFPFKFYGLNEWFNSNDELITVYG